MTAKILVLSFERVPGIDAAGQHLSLLLPALSRHAEIDALSLKCDELGHIQRLGTARILRVPSSSNQATEQVAAFERAVHRQLEAESYDLVWCSDLISAHSVATFEGAAGCRLVVDLFDLPSQTFCARHGIEDRDGQLARVLRRQEIIALRAAQRVLVHSQILRQALLALNVPPERIQVLPIGLDGTLFSPPSIEIPGDPNACAVGLTLEPFDLHLLDEVLAHWATLPHRLHAVILRDAPPGPELGALLERHALGRRARLEHAGTPERLAEVLTSLDAMLCWASVTEATETLGRVPMLALAALFTGRPVVSVDSLAARELFGEADAATRVAPGDLASIGPRLVELAGSSALRKRLATRTREAASRVVDGERYLIQARQVIEQCLGRALPVLEPSQPVDSASSYQPERIAGIPDSEVQHTPVLPRPLASHAPARPAPPTAPPAPLPEPPAPRAMDLSEAIDAASGSGDPWEHDTIATPMDGLQFDGVVATLQDESGARPDASLRSMALLERVAQQDGADLETEIIDRDAPVERPLPSGQETERLDLSESLVQRLQRAPARPALEVPLDEETQRLPAYVPPAATRPPRLVPVPVFEDADVDPAHYSGSIVDELTDRDQVRPAPAPRPTLDGKPPRKK